MKKAQRSALHDWTADFVLQTTFAIFLGVLGPFGNYFNGPVWQRAGYWVLLAWLGLAVYGVAIRWITARIAAPAQRWAALAVLVLLMSVPFGLVSWRLASWIWPVLHRAPGLTPFNWYLEGLIITVPQVVFFARRVAGRRTTPQPTGVAPGTGVLGTTPAEVLCLQMEDHYVRVHTARGSRLMLATFAQAQAALGDAPGLRVHRSWWVARRAVARAVVEGRNLRLELTNGLSAPVARSSVAAVRAAGWLGRDEGEGAFSSPRMRGEAG